MKLIVLGCLALIAHCKASLLFTQNYNWLTPQPSAGDVKEVREAIFTQWVDHSNQANLDIFEQYVYINDEYYQPGGPVLIFVSASSDMFAYWLQNSHMTNIAHLLGGIIYALEPRYFGRSYPTSDVSVENLKNYLHVNQTMADYVAFITYLRGEFINFDSDKFVLFGHGRGGTLALWLHQRYPGLADGLWAVSAPETTLFDFGWYYDEILQTIENEFPISCQQTIMEAFTELELLIHSQNIDKIREIFIFDSELNLSDRRDIALFYTQLFGLLSSPIEYGTPLTNNLICGAFEPLEGYSSLQLLGNFYGTALNSQIFNYVTLMSHLRVEDLEAAAVISHKRQDLYIRCTGWADFKTSSQMSAFLYRFPSDIFGNACEDIFGISYDDAVLNAYRMRGENQFNPDIRNVYFTNAQFDPHHIIGITDDRNPTAVADLIPRLGKLHDFYRFVELDAASNALNDVRDRAIELITLWTSTDTK